MDITVEEQENPGWLNLETTTTTTTTTTLNSEDNEENAESEIGEREGEDGEDPFRDENVDSTTTTTTTTTTTAATKKATNSGDDDGEFGDIFEQDDGEDIFAPYTRSYQGDEEDIFEGENEEEPAKKLSRLVKKHKEEKKNKKNKKSKRRDSDEEGSDGEKKKKKKKRSRKSEGDGEASQQGGEEGEKKKKKRRKSDGDGNANEPEEQEVNELGDEDDDERTHSSARVKKNKDWFDEYLGSLKKPRPKKLEDKDILELSKATVEKMDLAAHEDMIIYNRKSNVPALNKISILKEIKTMLSKRQLWEELVHQGVLKSIKLWLDPLPDKSWPSLDIRTALFESLAFFPVGEDSLRESGVGKNVMLYYKSPKETMANKKLARALIEKWSRPIFGLSSRYEDLEQAELEIGEKRKTSLNFNNNALSEVNSVLEERTREVVKLKERNHANIPQRAVMDFSKRPESRPITNAVLPSSHRSSVLAEKYIKKKMKGKATGISQMRAVKISVEGRGRF